MYRPFTKTFVYFDASLNDMRYQNHKFFPNTDTKNKYICVTGVGSQRGYSVIASDTLPDVQLLQNCQYFSLNSFEHDIIHDGLFAQKIDKNNNGSSTLNVKILEQLKLFYDEQDIENEDLFNYCYARIQNLFSV